MSDRPKSYAQPAVAAGCVVLAAVFVANGIAGFTTFSSLRDALLAVAGGLVAVGLGRLLLRAGGRLAGGHSVTSHAHSHGGGTGERLRIARHEYGHIVGAEGVGGRVHSVHLTDHGGLVKATVPNARAAVTFLYAGQVALGSSEGSGADNANIRRTLREFPSNERNRVRRECRRDAERIVSRNRGRINRGAPTLARTGRP